MVARTNSALAQPQTSRPGGVNPLIKQLNLKDLLEHEKQKDPEPEIVIVEERPETALASHVRLSWGRNKVIKQQVDVNLLKCLRARRGVYSAAEVSAMQQGGGGMNIVYTDLTETKCRAASAWIREILLPVGEQPWGVEPTPIPDLPQPMKEAIVNKALQGAQQALQQAAQAGGGVMDSDEFRALTAELGDKLRSDAEREYQKASMSRAKRMEKQIADRMVEGNYQQAMDGFIEDFVTYPAAILKGPIYRRNRRLEWTGSHTPKIVDGAIQWWERVSPFDIYPAPGSTSPQQGDMIERMRFRRDELHGLKGLPGYKDDQIDAALRDYVEGHLEGWLWTEIERQRLEQETMYMWLSPHGIIDALNYWGSVPGWKLISWGVEGDLEETREYECNVVLCGRYVLYAALNPDPLHQRPYRKASYDDIPGAFWGRSIPDLASTSQKMCNGLASALADNLAMASGPQIWVHADRFADGENSMEQYPWKIWQLKSDPTQGVNPGIGFFQPPSNAESLMATYEKWEIRADDATGIPRYTYGNERAGGSADTATGLGMLMTNAAKGLRRAISSCDMHVTGPTVADCFTNEMLYNPDMSIKGDCIPVPRGAAAILIREAAQQRRIQFATMTANPIDAPLIGAKHRIALLREVAASLELPVDEVLPNDDEIDANMKAQADQQQQQMQLVQQGKQQDQAFELKKEAIISDRETQAQSNSVMADIVRQAVTEAMGAGKKPAKQFASV